MNFKWLSIFLTTLFVLVFSTLAAWYEGGQIHDDPWQWKHTALFSNWLNGRIIAQSEEILVIDHFIYAAKFQPLFPLLMLFSFLILLVLALYPKMKRSKSILSTFLLLTGFGSSLLSFALKDSPVFGFKLFCISFGILSACSFLLFVSLLFYWKSRNKNQSEITTSQ